MTINKHELCQAEKLRKVLRQKFLKGWKGIVGEKKAKIRFYVDGEMRGEKLFTEPLKEIKTFFIVKNENLIHAITTSANRKFKSQMIPIGDGLKLTRETFTFLNL